MQNLSPARGYGDANVTAAHAAGIRGMQGCARCTLRIVWIIKASQVKPNYHGVRLNDKFRHRLHSLPAMLHIKAQHNTTKMPPSTVYAHPA